MRRLDIGNTPKCNRLSVNDVVVINHPDYPEKWVLGIVKESLFDGLEYNVVYDEREDGGDVTCLDHGYLLSCNYLVRIGRF